jgi:hypothetical protein
VKEVKSQSLRKYHESVWKKNEEVGGKKKLRMKKKSTQGFMVGSSQGRLFGNPILKHRLAET